MFTCIHSTQEDSWRPVREAIAIHTNAFSTQQEQEGMTSPNKRITVTSLLCWPDAEDLTGDIIREENQIKTNDSTPLIEDLEMSNIFKDKDDEEGNSVIDELITEVSQLLELIIIVAVHTAGMWWDKHK